MCQYGSDLKYTLSGDLMRPISLCLIPSVCDLKSASQIMNTSHANIGLTNERDRTQYLSLTGPEAQRATNATTQHKIYSRRPMNHTQTHQHSLCTVC